MNTAATQIEREPASRRAPRDIHARLKHETAPEHAAIEAATGVMNPHLRLSAYRAYLERTLGFYEPVEARLAELGVWEALGLDPAARQKVELIDRDITLLGGRKSLVPLCAAPPQFQSLGEAIGAAYVLEGSTLGGRVISRHVQSCLGPHMPRRFLECYGAKTGENWQTFRGAMARFAKTRELENELIGGAKKTFVSFTRWLNRV
jgi:heme oxygenase